jgi:hypothetical protein
MPTKLREKISKKLADPTISREKLDRIKNLLEKIIPEENKIVKTILQKDPLFFINSKRKKSRKILAEKLQDEKKLQTADLSKVEQELVSLLTT